MQRRVRQRLLKSITFPGLCVMGVKSTKPPLEYRSRFVSRVIDPPVVALGREIEMCTRAGDS